MSIIGYPRKFDDIEELEIDLAILRMSDARHDFKRSIAAKYIIKTIPGKLNVEGIDEDNILKMFVYNSDMNDVQESVKGRYHFSLKVKYDKDTVDDDNEIGNSNDDSKFTSAYYSTNPYDKQFPKSGHSNIEKIIEKYIKGDIFLHVDISNKNFKKDISYFKNRKVFWVNSKTQNYDAAKKTHPLTKVGKKICGWGNRSNQHFFYAWENTMPGIKQNLFYPKWNREYEILESYLFTRYNIFMQSMNDSNPMRYMDHESNIIICDPLEENKFVYADKSLSNKNGSNIEFYSKILKTKIKNLFESFKNSTLFKSISTLTDTPTSGPFTKSSLVVSKYIGDASQYLFAGLSGIHYMYMVNEDNKVKQVVSNRNNAFVSCDRIAIAGAIHANIPIVIYDKGSEFDIFILKEITNVSQDGKYNQVILNSLIKEINEQVEYVKELLESLPDEIVSETGLQRYEVIKKDIGTYFDELMGRQGDIITSDAEYQTFIRLIVFLLVPFNLSTNIITPLNVTEIEANLSTVNGTYNTLITEIDNYKKRIDSIEKTEVKKYIDEKTEVKKYIDEKKLQIEGYSKQVEQVEQTIDKLRDIRYRLVVIYLYFKSYGFNIHDNEIATKLKEVFNFSTKLDAEPDTKFKDIINVQTATPFANRNIRFSIMSDSDDSTLLPRAVQLFMTDHLVKFIYSLDSDLGQTIKPNIKKILNKLFNRLTREISENPINENFRTMIRNHIGYLNRKTNLDITPLENDSSTKMLTGGNGFQEKDENIFNAVTLIYFLIHNFINQYNGKTIKVIYVNEITEKEYNYSSIISSLAREVTLEEDTYGKRLNYVNDIKLVKGKEEKVQYDVSDISDTTTSEVSDVGECVLDIITFPIDTIIDYLDENINEEDFINTSKKILNSEPLEINDFEISDFEISGINDSDVRRIERADSFQATPMDLAGEFNGTEAQSIPINSPDDSEFKTQLLQLYDTLNSPLETEKDEITIYINKSFKPFFEYLDTKIQLTPMIGNFLPVEGVLRLGDGNQSPEDTTPKNGKRRFEGNNEEPFPKYRRGGKQTMKKRVSRRKIPSKPYVKQTKKHVKRRKYRTLKNRK
jgi:hypothetical protein